MNRLLGLAAVALSFALAGCHSGRDAPRSFTVGGSVTGLTASGLTLSDKGGDSFTVPVNATSFTFSSPIASGGSYDVAVATQPIGLTCTVAQGAGSDLQQEVTDVSVSCIPVTYAVSGTIAGLSASGLVLTNNGGDSLNVLAGSNSFQFSSPVHSGGQYDVAIASQPSGLTCTVSRGSGTNVVAAVNNIAIACGDTTYTVGGSISGLTASGLTIEDNGSDSLTVQQSATSFQFATPVSSGSAYDVTVATQPSGLTCTVADAAGSHVQANITTVQITCNAATFAIGGTVSGLAASGLVLQDNAADNLAVSSGSATFLFDTPVAYDSPYDVTVLSQPTGETCTVDHGAGTATQTVSDVAVSCAVNPTYTVVPSATADGIISPDTPQSVNSGGSVTFTATPNAGYAVNQWLVDGTAVQSGGSVYSLTNVTANHTVQVSFAEADLALSISSLALATAGNAREITVQNAGSITATNVTVSPGVFPSGTVVTTTCGTSLAPADTCSITITPGASATSACNSGTAPTPTIVSIAADDASTAQAGISVLSVGCLYQGGYLYSIDDTTSTSESIGGAVVAEVDASSGATWFNGSYVATNAQSLTDGASNTETILAVQGAGTYAAEICAASTTAGYTGWYLPAQGEWREIASGLAQQGIGNMVSAFYWSSTEFSSDPQIYATAMADPATSGIFVHDFKSMDLAVRCARQLTP